MPNTAPIDVIRTYNRTLLARDFDAALALIAPNCEYDNVPVGKVFGPVGVRGVIEPFLAPILESEAVVLREAVNGAVVFLERLDRHRFASGWIELPISGVYEVHDGLITLYRDYFDLGTLRRLWPKPAA
jgi:limonene-1,2-epoxide hydrolase